MAAATSRGPKGRDDKSFFEAVLWILRTGAPWRDLPEAFGKWSRSYRRFRRWALAGRWETLRHSLRRPESKLVLIDSTIIKAHPHAAGALRRTGGQSAQALGRSRGGLTTKLHAAVVAGTRPTATPTLQRAWRNTPEYWRPAIGLTSPRSTRRRKTSVEKEALTHGHC
jgi:transposase